MAGINALANSQTERQYADNTKIKNNEQLLVEQNTGSKEPNHGSLWRWLEKMEKLTQGHTYSEPGSEGNLHDKKQHGIVMYAKNPSNDFSSKNYSGLDPESLDIKDVVDQWKFGKMAPDKLLGQTTLPVTQLVQDLKKTTQSFEKVDKIVQTVSSPSQSPKYEGKAKMKNGTVFYTRSVNFNRRKLTDSTAEITDSNATDTITNLYDFK